MIIIGVVVLILIATFVMKRKHHHDEDYRSYESYSSNYDDHCFDYVEADYFIDTNGDGIDDD